MKQRYAVALVLAAVTAFLLLTRHHLRDIVEVATTYATFHSLVQRHAGILYRYPPTDSGESGIHNAPDQVPKVIHQIFLQDGRDSMLQTYGAAIESCRDLQLDWEHKLWTDDNATAFIREHYPVIAPHYESYAQTIQRANVLRYALLDHFGGIYLDQDITCLAPLDDLLHLPWLTPGAYPAGVNNAFILSRPHHPFLQELLGEVPSHDLKWAMPYVENMLSTGCMYFTNRWMAYVRGLARRCCNAIPDEERVYILADHHGGIKSHMLRGRVTTPLLAHGGASSWHGWDAAVIVLIGKYYRCFSMLMGVGMLFSMAGIWRFMRRSRKNRNDGVGSQSRLLRGRGSTEKSDDEEKLLVGKIG